MAVFQPPPTWASPILIDERTKQSQFNPVWLKWFLDLVGVINESGGGSGAIQHNDTASLQGGTANQYYHLTSAQNTFIGAITATAVQINKLAVGLSVTIVTAKLTGGGTDGSMTFTNGVLTAQTAAT